VSEEICTCGHRKSQHKAIVCGWWNCHCKQFEPLTAEPKRERKPFEEFPYAGDIISADVAAQEVISADVAAQEVEQLRSKLRAAQEEIGRLKQLQDGNHMLANRLGAENNLLREVLSEIKRLVEAILARP
jgi:hypothetical protein